MGHVAVGEWHTLLQAAQRLLVGYAVDLGLVLLLHAAAGVRDRVGPLAVGGQEQQPLGVAVEPAHIEEALGPVDQGERGGAAVRVTGGRHRAGRLVEHDVDVPLGSGGQRPPVDRDRIAGGVGLRAGLGHDLPVDGDAARRQQPLGPASRGHPRIGQ